MRSIAPWRAAAASFVLVSLGVAACSSGTVTPRDAAYEPMPQEPMPVDAGADGDATTTVDGAQCTAIIEQHADEGAAHVSCTSTPTYRTQPPSSGAHFGCWPEYRTFDVPVPWGNLVHGLEHGAMVIVYNCGSTGCPDEVARAQTFIDTRPPDPTCGTNRRVILAPDPTLSVRWAATAWRWTLVADCFDEASFGQFYAEHLGQAPEDICGGGYPYANLCCG